VLVKPKCLASWTNEGLDRGTLLRSVFCKHYEIAWRLVPKSRLGWVFSPDRSGCDGPWIPGQHTQPRPARCEYPRSLASIAKKRP
jgi:hypothetical protein